MHTLKPEFLPLPTRMQRLPVDARGYPVPWFVAWVPNPERPGELQPDFRVVDAAKFVRAVKERLCWVCGQPLGVWLGFCIGPMCAITRTISEPPSHRECVEWSIKHCPFLANPHFTRNLNGLPTDVEQPSGFGVMRNPGVACLWITRSYELFRVPGPPRAPLITIGDPAHVSWWREGRAATRDEVDASIGGGMPALLEVAKIQGPFAVEQLGKQYAAAQRYWPAEEFPPGSVVGLDLASKMDETHVLERPLPVDESTARRAPLVLEVTTKGDSDGL